MGVVDDAIENHADAGRVADDSILSSTGELTCDDGRSPAVTIF